LREEKIKTFREKKLEVVHHHQVGPRYWRRLVVVVVTHHNNNKPLMDLWGRSSSSKFVFQDN